MPPITAPSSPRAHAARLLDCPDENRRQRLLEQCPAEWRPLVLQHVANAEERRQARHAKPASGRDSRAKGKERTWP